MLSYFFASNNFNFHERHCNNFDLYLDKAINDTFYIQYKIVNNSTVASYFPIQRNEQYHLFDYQE